MRLRIATFNVENLASRHAFGPSERPETKPGLSLFDVPKPEERATVERSVAVALEDDKRELTALAIADTRADILLLQEVDNLGVLQPFFSNYVHRLSDKGYSHFRLIDGNDPRGMDVAFAARTDLFTNKAQVKARSHGHETFAGRGVWTDDLAVHGIKPEDPIFRRDCLELALNFGDRDLTLFLCHFKAIPDRVDGRQRSRPNRRAEAEAVKRIVRERFGDGWRGANWIVAGDLNDFVERVRGSDAVAATPSGLDPLFDDFAINPVSRLPASERWTYFHRQLADFRRPHLEEHVQLDYLLLSPALAAANPDPPVTIIRRGLPYRVPLDPAHPDRSVGHLATRADRYPRVGWDRPKASDHCPLVMEIDVPGRC